MQVVIGLLLTTFTLASGKVVAPDDLTAFDYHARFGIPEAERIKTAEEQLATDPSRIIGGSHALLGAYPYQAGLVVLLSSGATSVCGASVITNSRLLTAAHCWFDGSNTASQFEVVLGSVTLFTGGTRIVTTSVIMHEGWSPFIYANDIAIVAVSWITYTNVIQPVSLPFGIEQNNNFVGYWAVATGFGRTSDAQLGIPANQVLSEVHLPIITNAVCAQSFGTLVLPSNICTSGEGFRGVCGGDSGGPLTVISNNRRVLVGVTSFGAGRCEGGFPGVFARVTHYLPWIQPLL